MRSNTGAPNNSPPLPFLIIGVGLIKILLQYIIDFSEYGREEGAAFRLFPCNKIRPQLGVKWKY